MLLLLGTILVRMLEGMFVVGAFGSTIVLLLTAVEDLQTLLGREDSQRP